MTENAQSERRNEGPTITLTSIAPDLREEKDPEDAGQETGLAVAPRRPGHIVTGTMSTVAAIVLALVALLAVGVSVSTHFATDGQLGVLGHPVMSVLSGSMAPAIDTGDLVVDNKLTAAQATDLHIGQIISFRAAAGSSEIFTHRIAGVEALPGGVVAYVTKGDANDSRDGPLAASTNVIGLYHSRIPYGGYVLNALHRPLVLGLLVLSPLLWLLSGALWAWARTEEQTPSSTTEGIHREEVQ
jgi:signal peptidase I